MGKRRRAKREIIKDKILKFLGNYPERLHTLGKVDRAVGDSISLEFLESLEREGLIEIRPFPQGKEIFIGLPEQLLQKGA
ncbi:MAG: hypothetical protein V3T98_00385 [Candidatus Paceibacterota bacterium]